MNNNEAAKIVDALLTEQAKAARPGSGIPQRLTTPERRAIEKVLDAAIGESDGLEDT